MTESDELYATDKSLRNSVSLHFSEGTTSDSDSESSLHPTHTGRSKQRNTSITPEEKLRICERRFDSYHNKGLTERALAQLIKLVPLRRLVYGDNHWKYAEAYMKLAKGYLEYKCYQTQANNKVERAKDLILACNSPPNNEKFSYTRCLVDIYLILGKSLIVACKYKGAENALLKSWQVLKSMEKQASSIQIPTGNFESAFINTQFDLKLALSDVYIATKDIDKAISALNFLTNLLSKSTSDKDARLLLVYSRLMKAESARKKSEINHELVIQYAMKAHDISTSTHPLHSVHVADTAFALGRAYASVDSDKMQSAGETYYKEAQSAYSSCYGANHEKTLEVQDALNKIWMRTGKENDVINTLKSSLPMKRETFGECSVQVSETHKLIAGIHLTKGNLTKSHYHLKESVMIDNELYGPQHTKTKLTRNMLNQVEDNPAFKSGKTKLTDRPNFTSTIKSAR